MCADAKMMRLLAAEIRAELSARKRSNGGMDQASIRKAATSAAAICLAALVLLGLATTATT